MKKTIQEFLGHGTNMLLQDVPYNGWSVKRSVESEELPFPVIHYSFPDQGIELQSDHFDNLSTIFLFKNASRVSRTLAGIDFSWRRSDVLKMFGIPSRSGQESADEFLGQMGAWDRFATPFGAIHFAYEYGRDAIQQVTLMRADVVP